MGDSRLGKGLESLIPTYGDEDKGTSEIEIDKISANPNQPRKEFNDAELKELSVSIAKFGVIQPLVVVKKGDGYELVAGERRLRASKMAGLKTVPAVVREAGEQDKLEMAVVENIQRADLNPMELCFAYTRLNDEYGLTQEEIADKFGKSRPAVANCMRLADLPELIQKALIEGKISEGHARALLSLDDKKEMIGLFELMIVEGWSVRETENRVKGFKHPEDLPKPRKEISVPSAEESAFINELRDSLGAKVTLKRKAKGGTLEIEFYSDEELERIVEQIKKK